MAQFTQLHARRNILWSEVIGTHGQCLGQIEELIVDKTNGNVAFVLLATPWSTVKLEWDQLVFDENQSVFRIRPG